MTTPFESALRTAILAYTRTARRSGTTAMSVDNLLQCVRPPSTNLAGAPLGTNARYYYAQLFRRLCAEPLIAGFTSGQYHNSAFTPLLGPVRYNPT